VTIVFGALHGGVATGQLIPGGRAGGYEARPHCPNMLDLA